MNSETETLLLQEIEPRLRAAIPKTIPIVGPDDPDELLQDGLAIAIQIHRGAIKAKKKVSSGNIAHYTLLALRSGRRSTGFKKNDVLHPAAQLNGHARVQSLDESVRYDEEGEEPLSLHDCLASEVEDPATAAVRHLDWERVVQSLDRRAKLILVALVEGRELTLLVHRLKRSRSALQGDKARLGRLVQSCLGRSWSRHRAGRDGRTRLKPSGNDLPAARNGGLAKRTRKGIARSFSLRIGCRTPHTNERLG